MDCHQTIQVIAPWFRLVCHLEIYVNIYFILFLQCIEIRKITKDLIVIGKPATDNDKEDFDNDADDDDPDNAEESEGDEFEQETVWFWFLVIPIYMFVKKTYEYWVAQSTHPRLIWISMVCLHLLY